MTLNLAAIQLRRDNGAMCQVCAEKNTDLRRPYRYKLSRNHPATRPTTLPRCTRGASAAVIWRAISFLADTASRGP